MSWSYRIVHYRTGGFGLHEVYYEEDGTSKSMTVNPVGFVCDDEEGIEGIRKSLNMALADISNMPVFDEPESWD